MVKLFCTDYMEVFTFFCAFHRGRSFCEFVPQCLHIPNEDSASLCTWLKLDPGLIGSTGRHVEILEFTGGSLKWLEFDSK